MQEHPPGMRIMYVQKEGHTAVWGGCGRRLVGERFERCTLRDELLVSELEAPLLLDDPRDLIADNLRQLVPVRHHIWRDAGEEGELLERLLDDAADSRALDDGQGGAGARHMYL